MGGKADNQIYLIDAYEGKTYAEYHQRCGDGQHYWDTPPSVCTMLDRSCKTQEEYENFVKRFMDEN